MIVTVTMNPAIDKTIEIDRLNRGNLNRIEKIEYDAGGKGINVSKTIRELGGESIATGFLGGNAGRVIEEVLDSRGIKHDFVWVDGETRTNTKVCEQDGTVTELNEKGPEITPEQLTNLLEKLDDLADDNVLFILAGSIPGNMEKDIYARIIERVHKKGAKVLLDADRELFRKGLEQKPDMIKPNQWEIEELQGFSHGVSDKELINVAEKMQKDGIDTVVISLGKNGALFVLENYVAKGMPLKVDVHSTVGAGDAMVAAMAYSFEKKMEPRETARLCMAVSAGAVMTVGTKPPEKQMVEQLMKRVILEEV
ncbi:MAG TPA: 1-phosphofructokinase [Candidatus Blautia intestinavium]|nr:1-phosphofructokinase [Candidatus Blautia intestinavium]